MKELCFLRDPRREVIREEVYSLVSPRLEISGRHIPLKIAALTKQSSPHNWKSFKVQIGP
jgi:hypothetical protein